MILVLNYKFIKQKNNNTSEISMMGMSLYDIVVNYTQVTWVEHAEYDESQIHQLYRPLLSSGMGFGAQRWVTTLQRQCECLAILISSAVPSREHSGTFVYILYRYYNYIHR